MITGSISDNELECPVIEIMKTIDIGVDNCDIESSHRISKSKGNSKKTIVRFCNRKISKRALNNKKKVASVKTSAVRLRNSIKFFTSKNLTDYNNKLTLNVETLKSFPHS